MRSLFFALGPLLIGGFSTACAQSSSPLLITGSIEPVIRDECYVNRGLALYERDIRIAAARGSKAIIIFPEIFVGQRNTNKGWDVSGHSVLSFNDADSGSISFKHSAVKGVFSRYRETRGSASGQIKVSFMLNIPNAHCELPITLDLERSGANSR